MAQTESLLTIVVFIIVSVVILGVVFFSFSAYQEKSYRLELSIHKQESERSKIDTLFSIDDMYSQDPLLETALSSIRRGGIYKTKYGDISINRSLKEQFDQFFGEGNYYAKVNFSISKAHVYLLVDDGSFMERINEVHNFPSILDGLTQELEARLGEDKVFTQVIVLSTRDLDQCTTIYEGANCERLSWSDLYSTFQGQLYTDLFKEAYPNNKTYVTNSYASNDWATFLSRAAGEHSEFAQAYGGVSIFLLFTDVVDFGGPSNASFVTDRQPLMSGDEMRELCSHLPTAIAQAECEWNVYNHWLKEYSSWLFDFYCTKNEDFTLSDEAVERAIDFLEEQRQFVFPLVVRVNDFAIPGGAANSYQRENVSWYAQEQGLGTVTGCLSAACPGCGEDPNYPGSSVFHPETREKHLEQVTKVATKTGGEVIMYDENTDLEEQILGLVTDTLAKNYVTLGEQREGVKKDSYQRRYLISEGSDSVVVNTYIEVYEDDYEFNGNFKLQPGLFSNFTDETGLTHVQINYDQELSSSLTINDIAVSEFAVEEKPDNVVAHTFTVPLDMSKESSVTLTYQEDGETYSVVLP
ncbi:hypothetical protein H6501_03535 [Candidatus Woesearchaeota archaeon]|nr:hypothetical protein [Candidatus Woesearchaeota archaeon]USN43726.1 MAG: hypothetical protein H6500_05035 [Candidatus Woesearchaeota archaeon]